MMKANRKAVNHARQQKISDLCNQLRFVASEQKRSTPNQPVESAPQQLPTPPTPHSQSPLDQSLDS